jgi:RNA polymerase sigma factor (sigma-70 family)
MSSTNEEVSRRQRFEELYADTRIGILGYLVRRVSSPSDAADLLAQTYLTVWQRMDVVPSDGTARMWLYGVARRVLANHRRHEKVERTLAHALRADLTVALTQIEASSDSPYSEMIGQSLDTLGADDREVIELSAWEQLTPTEIACVIGMSPNAVRVRLHRARNALRSELTKAGFPQAGQRGCA